MLSPPLRGRGAVDGGQVVVRHTAGLAEHLERTAGGAGGNDQAVAGAGAQTAGRNRHAARGRDRIQLRPVANSDNSRSVDCGRSRDSLCNHKTNLLAIVVTASRNVDNKIRAVVTDRV